MGREHKAPARALLVEALLKDRVNMGSGHPHCPGIIVEGHNKICLYPAKPSEALRVADDLLGREARIIEDTGRSILLASGNRILKIKRVFYLGDPEAKILSYLNGTLSPRIHRSQWGGLVIVMDRLQGVRLDEYLLALDDIDPILDHVGRVAYELGLLHRKFSMCRQDWCRPEYRHSGRELRRRLFGRATLLEVLSPQFKSIVLKVCRGLPSIDLELAMLTHGDMHLGQVFLVGEHTAFIDFSGEPYKSPGRIGSLEPPVRDLAGLISSARYLLKMKNMETYLSDTAREILAMYRKSAPAKLIPSADSLLAWLAERASYELIYEIVEKTGLEGIPLSLLHEIGESAPKLSEWLRTAF